MAKQSKSNLVGALIKVLYFEETSSYLRISNLWSPIVGQTLVMSQSS